MQMTVYLSFNGQCEEAFRLYERCLGAKLGPIFRYAGSPLAGQVPTEWQEKVMHANLTIGDQAVMGADVTPGQYERPKGISLSLQLESPTEADRIFAALSDGGTVVMPLEETFWAARFGVVVDRFGVPWLINCDGSASATDA